MRIAELRLHRLRLPLATPYRIAIREIRVFDTVLVEAIGDDGAHGLGEATLLTGYTDETIEGAWAGVRRLGAGLPGLETRAAIDALGLHVAEQPFTITVLVSALEMLEGHALLETRDARSVPLLAIVGAHEAGELEHELERLLVAGYGSVKVKVGFDVRADLARVERIRRLLAGRALMRLDGNQGYSREQALAFVRGLDPQGIELLEQPCAARDWASALAVAEAAPVPMMLDESIYGDADIERAAATGAARYVKLKLMKAGGLDRLVAQLGRIAELGLQAVLGNGVAGDIGCWMEACVAPGRISGAGEMNGWLKPRHGIVTTPLTVEDGCLRVPAGYRPTLDRERLAAVRVDSQILPGGGAG